MRFMEVSSMEELLKADQKAIQEKVEDYTISYKNKLHNNFNFNSDLNYHV